MRGGVVTSGAPAARARARLAAGGAVGSLLGPAALACALATALAAALATLLPLSPLAAQEEEFPGVQLSLIYENEPRPALGVQPFTGSFGGVAVAWEVEEIVSVDLANSDRFQVLDSLPDALVGGTVDYILWDRIGATWLVTGRVEGAGDGFVLVLELHDVLYGTTERSGRFRLPDTESPDFRMAVHRASDEVVRWATGSPGMAASRIAFTMTDAQWNKDIYVIDSDGANLTRLTSHRSIALLPAWSPDASRIAYTSYQSGLPRIYIMDLASRSEDMLGAELGEGDYITPAFHPNGRELAFAVTGSARSGIFTYDISRDCCLANLTGGAHYDLSPTFSPDGSRLAFNTNRFGDAVPQIMVMRSSGGAAETLSPYAYGEPGYYGAPDWSPRGDLVTFHGRVERGSYHILVADLATSGRKLRQLTSEGNNEDPSWAPDGRHIAFVGERSWGFGLFVVDVASGRLRLLVAGRNVGLPAWSGAVPEGG